MQYNQTVWLVPGIRSFGPNETMGPLLSTLASYGIRGKVLDYGYIAFPITNGRAKAVIREKVKTGDVLVGYSNGAAAVHAIADEICPKHVIEISPALAVDAEYPPCVESVTCFYSPGDIIVAKGGVYAWTVNMMPWRWGSSRNHPWGRRGIDGPAEHTGARGIEMGHDIAHSWFRHEHKVDMIAREIARICGATIA